MHYQERSLGQITMSLGVATFPRNGHSPEAVLEAADMALYQAKREGRNRVIIAGVRAGGLSDDATLYDDDGQGER
jgi:diguanylate cyclase (GGDEF)-like protein